MVANDNQKQIYRWVRNYFLLPSGREYYTDLELRQSVEVIILLKSSCPAIHDNFIVTKNSLQGYMNVILPPLKRSFLNHLWYLMSLGEINNKSVRKTTTENFVKKNQDRKLTFSRTKKHTLWKQNKYKVHMSFQGILPPSLMNSNKCYMA